MKEQRVFGFPNPADDDKQQIPNIYCDGQQTPQNKRKKWQSQAKQSQEEQKRETWVKKRKSLKTKYKRCGT